MLGRKKIKLAYPHPSVLVSLPPLSYFITSLFEISKIGKFFISKIIKNYLILLISIISIKIIKWGK